ncbi:hypothetical protein U5640_36445 [Streptomyces sp. SS7]|uniref:hypothetical protein n=1 Tax=Streptomyces sp. SS7 TaxID=3108485 RepID=UPI0030EDFB07
MASSLFVSSMRTLVPLGAALLVSWSGRLGIPVDSEAAAAAVALGFAGAYYLTFRGLEALAEHMAWRPLRVAAGMLLGWARPPAYAKELVVPLRLQVDREHLDAETRAAWETYQRVLKGGSG